VIDLSRYIDARKKVVRSITGEVALDHGNGLCTVDTPKAQGACGFLAKAGVIRLGDVAIRSQNGYATHRRGVDGWRAPCLVAQNLGSGWHFGPADRLEDPGGRVPRRGW